MRIYLIYLNLAGQVTDHSHIRTHTHTHTHTISSLTNTSICWKTCCWKLCFLIRPTRPPIIPMLLWTLPHSPPTIVRSSCSSCSFSYSVEFLPPIRPQWAAHLIKISQSFLAAHMINHGNHFNRLSWPVFTPQTYRARAFTSDTPSSSFSSFYVYFPFFSFFSSHNPNPIGGARWRWFALLFAVWWFRFFKAVGNDELRRKKHAILQRVIEFNLILIARKSNGKGTKTASTALRIDRQRNPRRLVMYRNVRLIMLANQVEWNFSCRTIV